MKRIMKWAPVCAVAVLSILAGALLEGCRGGSSSQARDGYDPDAQQLFIGDDIAVAPTAYGRVKGFILRGIYTFRGIPYGADTGGENRFMPPRPPEPWDDVRPAVYYPEMAPQREYGRGPESYGAFVDAWNYDLVGEDCLRLNVWSPGLDDRRRPVLVWLHGGGFTSGSAIEQDGYEGENFARYGDAVFVSINHRLNAFGFTDLSAVGGEKYRHSGNVGMLDVIAALQWVNKNIAAFGGDPGNVTVIGQSGGGSKVCMVSAMPAARGIVHKGVALSGNTTAANDKEYAEKLGAAVLAEAGLTPDRVDELQQLPWEEYLDLANRAAARLRNESPGAGRGGFSPVADGVNIPVGTFWSDGSAAAGSPDIPMMFCSTFHERTGARDSAALEEISAEGAVERLKGTYGDRAQGVYDAYAAAFPELKPIEVYGFIVSNRRNVVAAADAKLAQSAPVWMAWFGFSPPLFDGRMRAFHCLDISFWLHNTDHMVTHSGGGKVPRVLADRMAGALAAFMRTGDPNTALLPAWPRYSAERGEVMVLDVESEVRNDPDREARKAL